MKGANKSILKTKSMNVDLSSLNESHNIGNTIEVFCEKLNTLYTLTIVNITLSRDHWVLYLK